LVFVGREGDVLEKDCRGLVIDRIEAPPYSSELKYAESLLPDGLAIIVRDPLKVCAAALNARARCRAPPLRLCAMPRDPQHQARKEEGAAELTLASLRDGTRRGPRKMHLRKGPSA
jgi:hypothetical protein